MVCRAVSYIGQILIYARQHPTGTRCKRKEEANEQARMA